MLTIDPKDKSTARFHHYILTAVSPRPIAFASTADGDGNINLSPFSFFNCFSSNPPIMVFSAARRVRDNTTKHTLGNILETKEVVINIVNYDLVQQMSLSSTEYPKGVDEFVKSGLTPVASEVVKPPRVAESPAQFECVVNDVVSLGEHGGAGNLIICEVVRMHIRPEVLDEGGNIDQRKIDTVARMGGNWYSRANDGMFEVPKPLSTLGIGVDQIPREIKQSEVLTGNDLGMLGNVEVLPEVEEVRSYQNRFNDFFAKATVEDRHQKAKELLASGDVGSAWKTLLDAD